MGNKKEFILSLLIGRAETNPLHWNDIVKAAGLTDKFKSREYRRLINAMNSVLMPCGSVRGTNHRFWIAEV